MIGIRRRSPRQLDHPCGCPEHRRLHVDVGRRGVGQELAALVVVGAVQPHDHRQRDVQPLERGQDALGDLVAAGDAAEDVEQHRPHLRVGEQHLHRGGDRRRLGAAAHVQEVGGVAAPAGRATTSSVDITSPAPLPRMPMSPPSSFT
jgi:hypothetical protein